jgi:hypothetical protein
MVAPVGAQFNTAEQEATHCHVLGFPGRAVGLTYILPLLHRLLRIQWQRTLLLTISKCLFSWLDAKIIS